jgi:hypothetical protein
MSDLRNSIISFGKTISDIKFTRKILRSLLERFRIKVTTIEESKDLEESHYSPYMRNSVDFSKLFYMSDCQLPNQAPMKAFCSLDF